MRYDLHREKDILIIRLRGSVRVNERLRIKQSLLPILSPTYRKVIVDLQDLTVGGVVYWVGVLNTIKKEVELMGGELKLCALQPEVYRFFRENRLNQIFDLHRSLAQAQKSFQGEESG